MNLRLISDHGVQEEGFLASWSAQPQGEITEEEEDSDADYLLTLPQGFSTSREVHEENVCLQLRGEERGDGLVTLAFWSEGKKLLNGDHPELEETITVPAGSQEFHCQRVKLPEDKFKPGTAMLRVKGEFAGSDYGILAYKPVKVFAFKSMILIQTDKGHYQPDQLLRVRFLVMDVQLRPSETTTELAEAWVTEPGGSRLAQWKDVKLEKGMAQVEYSLPEEPTLGRWKIHVRRSKDGTEADDQIAHFKVSERVLPKFEVTLEGPSVVTRDSVGETFKVCGVYTHGGKVNGKLNATFTGSRYIGRWDEVRYRANVTKPIVPLSDGCGEVRLDADEIRTLTNQSYSFSLLAVVTEGVTRTKMNRTHYYRVVDTPFSIRASAATYHHVLGSFPVVQEAEVVSHDGVGVEGVALEVCARLFTELYPVRKKFNQLRYSSDEDQLLGLIEMLRGLLYEETCVDAVSGPGGKLRMAVPIYQAPANVSKLSLKITAVQHPANETSGMRQPELKMDAELKHGELDSALAVPTGNSPKLHCGENRVRVFLSARRDSVVSLSHVLSSGNVIVDARSAEVEISGQDLEAEYVGDALVIDDLSVAGERREGVILTAYDIVVDRPLQNEGEMFEHATLLVSTTDGEGVTLSERESFSVESCAPGPAVRFSQSTARPGDKLSLKVEGEPDSLCGYSVVDKSVELLPNANKVTMPRAMALKGRLSGERLDYQHSYRHLECRKEDDTEEENKKRDAEQSLLQRFNTLGLDVMSDRIGECLNLKDVSDRADEMDFPKPIPIDLLRAPAPQPIIMSDSAQPGPPPPPPPRQRPVAAQQAFVAEEAASAEVAAFSASNNRKTSTSIGGSVRRNKVEVRNYFPETWLFDLVPLDGQGDADVDLEAPHTITTWIAEVFCSHSEAGLGVANKTELLVTQDFFADINMPYSVKRGEVLPVNVSVFNTVSRGLPIRLSVRESDAIKLDQTSQDLCLPGTNNDIKTFNIKARELHEVNITVEAKITDKAAAVAGGVCEAAGEAEGYTDILQKSIQVKPEGFPVEKVQSKFHCVGEAEEEGEELTLDSLELPDDLVPDSERAWVTVTGDIMAPSLSNLDRLVRMPTGCGEQTMIGMAPNVYLMDYLHGTGQSKPELEAKAKAHITKGYQREQQFRHSDGAYSVWGEQQDKVGSMWLTSFVVKVFGQASKFVNIPKDNVEQSVRFLLNNQLRNGCFRNVGFVLHSDLRGTDRSVTASALVTLLEVNRLVKVDPDNVQDALTCIRSNKTEEPYTKAVTAYALSLYNSMRQEISEVLEEAPEAEELVEDLLASANRSQPGQLYWEEQRSRGSGRARSVEMTGYAVLALTLQDRLLQALQAIKWLTTQRNAYGGFYSTQDTMVALQAISQYSLKVSGVEKDLSVRVAESGGGGGGGGDQVHSFAVDEDNKLLLQQENLAQVPAEFEVSASGQGCFMVQTVLRYNVFASPETESFSLRASMSPSNDALELCASYAGAGDKSANMAVMEIEMLTGYRPSALDALGRSDGVRKVEYDDEEGKVAMYFDEVRAEERCWSVALEKALPVEELKPAVVKLYDYYKTEDVVSVEYAEQEAEEK